MWIDLEQGIVEDFEAAQRLGRKRYKKQDGLSCDTWLSWKAADRFDYWEGKKLRVKSVIEPLPSTFERCKRCGKAAERRCGSRSLMPHGCSNPWLLDRKAKVAA